MNYEFVGYSAEFKSQIADLRSRVWGGTPAFNTAYLDWKYEQNPYLDEPILHLVLGDGDVLGMRGTYGSQWQFGGTGSRNMPTAADFIVDPDHRGRWVAQKLEAFAIGDLTARGYDYTFNTSPNLTTRVLRLRSGWKRGAVYQTYRHGGGQRSATPGRRATRPHRSLLSRAVSRAASELRKFKSSVPFKRFDKWAAEVGRPFVATATPRIAEMSELVARCSDASRIRHVRDERYYNWRFKDPRSQFRFVYVEQNARLEAFFILQQFEIGGPVTVIDWAASTADGWAELLDGIVHSKTEALQIVSTRFSEAQLKSIGQLNFEMLVEEDTRAHPAPGIFLRSLSDADANEWTLNGLKLLDADLWDMRMIYSDAF